jgi:two-component system cell cycle response regulator
MTSIITAEKHYALLNRITANLGLAALLDMLSEEIEELDIAEGYVINLIDAEHENLLSMKLRFTPTFAHLEGTFHKYKTSLASEVHSPTTIAFHERAIVKLDQDARSESDRDHLKKWMMNEFVVIPILDLKRQDVLPVGTVSLIQETGKFDESKIMFMRDLLSVFYVPLQTALQLSFMEQFHAKLKSAAQEHARALQFIVEVNNLTSREKIFELFTSELFKRFDFQCLGLFLREGDLLKNVMVTCNDLKHDEVGEAWARYLKNHHYGVHQADGGVSHAFEKNTPLVFQDVQAILHLPMSKMDTDTLRLLRTPRTLVIVPIRYQGHAIGVMTMSTLDKVLNVPEADLQLLLTLSAFFGAAITNSDNFAMREKQNREIERLNEVLQSQVVELAEQASTDKLTGLFNFRTYEKEIDCRISECQRSTTNEGLSIAVIDIDHFKRFNDTYGHGAGNQVLAGVAQTISGLVRKMDKAFRYGGEEFVVLMNKCPLDGCKAFAERVRQAVEEARFETEAGVLSVTISIGCATYVPGETSDSFFERADQALYSAKHNGRNQVAG